MKTTAPPWTQDWVIEHLLADRNGPDGPLLFVETNDGRFFVAAYGGMGDLIFQPLADDREALIQQMLLDQKLVAGVAISIPEAARFVRGHLLEATNNSQLSTREEPPQHAADADASSKAVHELETGQGHRVSDVHKLLEELNSDDALNGR